ncbi:MAG TPA: DUF4405 domain-containing protein [Sedimentisphaerales bacterium]|nr:DUF4405 domain-containing protein [Sedimentisphaerales bacterium]
MKRSTVNFIVDLVSFVSLLCLAFTGYIMKYILPPGTGGLGRRLSGGPGREHIREFWSMGRHDWGAIHFYLALLFVTLMVVHVVLHWTWIKSCLKSLFGFSQKTSGCTPDT